LSAINSGVKDIREVINSAKSNTGLFTAKNPIVFIDEIHRFSKSQQDSLLGAVEKGWITLIGATTENPSFEVIPALLSRCQVYTLKAFDKSELIQLIHRAITQDEIIQSKSVTCKEYDALIQLSGGDARKLLNIFELLVMSLDSPVEITNDLVFENITKNPVRYDKTGEQHYDIISAFIKSIRGSDPNASLYYLARMLRGGEDPKFIARRLIIAASEDIGNANPNALILANNTFSAVANIGMPEARIILSQCVVYLASSTKSNASYKAIDKALDLVDQTGDLSIPLSLRNAPTKLMKELNYGEGYKYSHDFEQNFTQQEFLPQSLSGTIIYEPGNNSRENQFRQALSDKWKGKYNY
jgi:putative ATPase